MRDTAGEAADRFHFLRLTKLSLQQQTFADILSNNEAHAPSGIFEFVGNDVHFEAFAVFSLVLPMALMAAILFPLFDVSSKRRGIAVGANITNGHSAKFGFGESVGFPSGFVDLKKLQSFRIENPHGKRSMRKQQTKHGFALANGFFGAHAFDGQSDVRAGRIEKFQIALIVGALILVVLNHQDADGGMGSLERNTQPCGRSRADQFHFTFRGEPIKFQLRDQAGFSRTKNVCHAGAGDSLRRRRGIELIHKERKMKHFGVRIVKSDEEIFRVDHFLEGAVNLVQQVIEIGGFVERGRRWKAPCVELPYVRNSVMS